MAKKVLEYTVTLVLEEEDVDAMNEDLFNHIEQICTCATDPDQDCSWIGSNSRTQDYEEWAADLETDDRAPRRRTT